MQDFRRDDNGYLAWLEHHPHSFIVNVDTQGKNRSMIHTSRCTHMYPPKAHKNAHDFLREGVLSTETGPLWLGTEERPRPGRVHHLRTLAAHRFG